MTKKKGSTARGRKGTATRDKSPSAMTVAELINTDAVPIGVRLWLEQYAKEGGRALYGWPGNSEPSSLALARLIYAVLNAPHLDVLDHNREDVQPAVTFVEDWLYRACGETHTHAYTVADVAVAALPYILDGSQAHTDCDATVNAMQTAIRSLTTNRTRRHFLPELADENESPAAGVKEERDYFAACKLARYMADPRAPMKARRELGETYRELIAVTHLSFEHPALVQQAATLAFETVKDGESKRSAVARVYRRLLVLLDGLPEAPEGEGGGQ